MEFNGNEHIAELIKKTYNLPQSTLNVWKTRNSIPKKYIHTEGGVVPPTSLESAKPQQVKMMRDILKRPELSIENFTSIKSTRAQDVIREKAKINAAEFSNFRLEVVQVRNILLSITQSKSFAQSERAVKQAVKDKRIKWYVLSTHRRTIDNAKSNFDIEVTDMEQFKIDCAVLSQSLLI